MPNVREVPASALRMKVGEFEISPKNGDGAKTAPVKMFARSGKPIEHPYWGRVVHDMAGMKLSKPKLPIDYNHDPKEILGYLNKFDSASGDLVASGALVPYKDDDRASEILYKGKEGVPYEASINFNGEGLKCEDVEEGHSALVNGYQFEGPGIIVRQWTLRGVAICPYGADQHTETQLSTSEEVVKVEFVSSDKEVSPMSEQNKNEEAEAKAKAEAEAAAKAKAEAEQLAAVEAKHKEEGGKFMAEFGEVKGAMYFAKGMKFAEAQTLDYAETKIERDALAKENAELKARFAQIAGSGVAPAAASAPAPTTVEEKGFEQLAQEFAASTNCSITKARLAVAKQNPAAYSKFRAGLTGKK